MAVVESDPIHSPVKPNHSYKVSLQKTKIIRLQGAVHQALIQKPEYKSQGDATQTSLVNTS